MSKARLLFISYSREDKHWLEQLRLTFSRQASPELADLIWCDQKIQPTDDWRKEIQQALEKTSVALLLISNTFHESDFIRNLELPELLKAHREGRLLLTWLRIDEVNYRLAVYSHLQSIHTPEPPLRQLSSSEQDRVLAEVTSELLQLLKRTDSGQTPTNTQTKRRNLLLMLCTLALLLIPFGLTSLGSAPRPVSSELLRLLHGNNWLSYEPRDFHPDLTDNVSEHQIHQELAMIRHAGFTGIITFGSRADLARIPGMARQYGLSVIMGIWNPNDRNELRNAWEQRESVDAYCVGHNCLSDDRGQSLCTLSELQTAIQWLRRQTGKPVSTTQLAKLYDPSELRLNTMTDFLFPDIHTTFSNSDFDEQIEQTLRQIRRMADIARQYDRPLVVKMLTYPVRRGPDEPENPVQQAEFFRQVLQKVRDPIEGPAIPVGMAPATAFDDEWKTGANFFDWDPYTGMFDDTCLPRPVVSEWMTLRP